MADGVFTLAAGSTGKDKIFPAIINKIELREGGSSDASQYQGLGRVADGKLDLKPAAQKSAGNVQNQMGYMLELSVSVLTTGTAMRTAINKILTNFSECRLTDLNGHKWTFIGGENGEMDLTVAESVTGDGENSRLFTITGTGYITAARFAALFAES